MHYRLRESIALRGWERLPFAYRDRQTAETRFLSREAFDALSRCDGVRDFADVEFTDRVRALLAGFEADGVIERSAAPHPIGEDQRYRRYPNRFVQGVQLSITGACNYACRHCYMEAPHRKHGELSFEALASIVDELAACGVASVALTGGEPLLRPDALELMKHIVDAGLRLEAIYTNGSLVTDELLEAIAGLGVHPTFIISYDGPGYHDWLRRRSGAEREAFAAFERCRDHGFAATAEMCVTDGNVDSILEAAEALAGVGCGSLKVSAVSDVGEWTRGGFGEPIARGRLWQALLDAAKRFADAGMPLAKLQLGDLFALERDGDPPARVIARQGCVNPSATCLCQTTRLAFYVSSEGLALPCASMADIEGVQERFPRFGEMPLAQMLSASPLIDAMDARAAAWLEANERCRACPHRLDCLGGCRARALAEGDYLGVDSVTCELFCEGWVERADEVARAINGRP